MKKIISLLVIATMASCSVFAQDDMYFTPKTKAVKEKEKAEAQAAYNKKLAEEKTAELEARKQWLRKNRHHLSQTEDGQLVYHVGSDRNVDEYNRHGAYASNKALASRDSVASDIIDFTVGNGQYPDSLISSIDIVNDSILKITTLKNYKKSKDYSYYDYDDDDYYYARMMNRFHGYYGSRHAWMLYNDPWYSHWAYDPFFWNDPWYWNSSWVYSPWYWSDPWFYGGFGWGYMGYHHHYGPGHFYYHNHYIPVHLGGTVNSHNSRVIRNTHGTRGTRQGYKGVSSAVSSYNRAETTAQRSSRSSSYVSNSGNFSGYRGSQSSNSSFSNSESSRSYSAPSSSSSSSRGSGGGFSGGGSHGGVGRSGGRR